ncbi:hypothetical protein H8A95_05760 [Bradyrhizobium sp. Pear76]|uniref:hypothetical protein n=1 Tax=Bradyrhizobium oropedii TaxID=1571201 RepID=UPI001E592B54|nr:hypothetical protein [Bradyrhizobium oropedii]MCC8961837.1 hypothetical protein [Bradyrhizobium oropedii]
MRTSGWLTIGKEYLVLEVFVDEQAGSRFRVISDDADTPILARSSEFEAVSDTIPKCWVVTFKANLLLFSPAAFRGDFWERYFDGDAAARNEFSEVVKLIENETR